MILASPLPKLNGSIERFALTMYLLNRLRAAKRSIQTFNVFQVFFDALCFQQHKPFNEIIERFIERFVTFRHFPKIGH